MHASLVHKKKCFGKLSRFEFLSDALAHQMFQHVFIEERIDDDLLLKYC